MTECMERMDCQGQEHQWGNDLRYDEASTDADHVSKPVFPAQSFTATLYLFQ
jgi:hypothetical protein